MKQHGPRKTKKVCELIDRAHLWFVPSVFLNTHKLRDIYVHLIRELLDTEATVPPHQAHCNYCAQDQEFLRTAQRPADGTRTRVIRIVDLFAGCGGMSVGFAESARRFGVRAETALAVDSDREVLQIYKRNVKTLDARACDVAQLFDRHLGARLSLVERRISTLLGVIDVLLGGPPCQGHSDLNNHTRRSDPKNALYLRMARAAEVLKPKFVVVENVATVQWDRSGVVAETMRSLKRCGYMVAGDVIDLSRIGVPQQRKRFVLLAAAGGADPAAILAGIRAEWKEHPVRTVRWAIEDLMTVQSEAIFETASARSRTNIARMAFLFKNGLYNLPNSQRPECHRDREHSYRSVYGRLRWSHPAQTITTGFGSMGQGRYVHPQRRRTITPHEAARLQTFPDWFEFGKTTRRGILAKAIGNAVPPLLMMRLGEFIVPALSTICEKQSAHA